METSTTETEHLNKKIIKCSVQWRREVIFYCSWWDPSAFPTCLKNFGDKDCPKIISSTFIHVNKATFDENLKSKLRAGWSQIYWQYLAVCGSAHMQSQYWIGWEGKSWVQGQPAPVLCMCRGMWMHVCLSVCAHACTYMYDYVHAGVCICVHVHMFTCVGGIKEI